MYRQRRRRCPGCDAPMEEVAVLIGERDHARVDLCSECGGTFLGFFDGDPSAVSRGVLKQHLARPTRRLPRVTGLECPDCRLPMSADRYLDEGPHVFRCPGCAALFASREQIQTLATFVPPEEPPPPVSLLERLRRLFFGDDASSDDAQG